MIARPSGASRPTVYQQVPAEHGLRGANRAGVGALLQVSRDALGCYWQSLTKHQTTPTRRSKWSSSSSPRPTPPSPWPSSTVRLVGTPTFIELTEGIGNEDDASALLCVFRGCALREQAYHQAAREAFKEALKSKKRDR